MGWQSCPFLVTPKELQTVFEPFNLDVYKRQLIYQEENSDDLKANNLYSPFSAQKTDSDYQIKGTIYLSSERDLVNVQANSEAEITLAGKLKKQREKSNFYMKIRMEILPH